jgi:hypothetical protein
MRTTLALGLLLILFAVSAAQAQHTTAPARDAQSALPVVEGPLSAPQADAARQTVDVQPPVDAAQLTADVQPNEEVVDVAARREMTARTLLAIVGGALIVVALIVLLR